MEPLAGGGQLITMIIPFLIIGIPTAILNANIAKRKGKSSAFHGWMSLIPFVGFLLAIYLVSLSDKDLVDKIERILAAIERNPEA